MMPDRGTRRRAGDRMPTAGLMPGDGAPAAAPFAVPAGFLSSAACADRVKPASMTATIILRIETSRDRAESNAFRPGMFPRHPDRALVFEILLERPADIRAIAFGSRAGEVSRSKTTTDEQDEREVVGPSSSVFTRGSIPSFYPLVRPPEDGVCAWPANSKIFATAFICRIVVISHQTSVPEEPVLQDQEQALVVQKTQGSHAACQGGAPGEFDEWRTNMKRQFGLSNHVH
jgi:hypothetical protein